MLEAKNIHKVYNDASKVVEVLKGVDLKIEKGEFIAIIGPSGAGKSTLLHILGGIDSPTKGNIVLGGEDIYKLNDTALCKIRNQRIGFVFQFYHLLPEFNVLENVLMPVLINKELKNKLQETKKAALSLLDEVGLKDRITHFSNQLSGGEQQRVALVRALINNPQVLLCDEPTGNLDSKTGSGIISLIRKINKENKMTVVLVTHNMELANIADKTYKLQDGKLVN